MSFPIKVDVSHAYQALLQGSSRVSEIPCENGLPATCYQLNERGSNSCYIEELIVCGKPRWFNSGSHRIMMQGIFQGERFAMTVEENEDVFCEPEGEVVYVAAETLEGEVMLKKGDKFVIRMLASFMKLSTGKDPSFPEIYFRDYCHSLGCTRVFRERFTIYHADYQDLQAQDCTLSEEADDCLLYAF